VSDTLFDISPLCERCHGIGLWREPNGNIVVCPEIRLMKPHAQPNAAATVLRRSVELLKFRNVPINALDFDIAKSLVAYDTKQPCERDTLLGRHFTWARNPLRHFHAAIEVLRATWLLPVGSRKQAPSGYWIITELDDFADWVRRSKSAPIKQLSTIHAVAKANFPVFAEQLELEFWSDIQSAQADPYSAVLLRPGEPAVLTE
jgi:hypothetical protein